MKATIARSYWRYRAPASTFSLTTVAVGLLACSGLAQADLYNTFCVATASELQDALNQASDGGVHNGESNLIYVVSGVYKTTDLASVGPFHYSSTNAAGYLELSGGYDPGCATHPRHAAGLTTLDGNAATQVLRLDSAVTGIFVSTMTIKNGNTTLTGAGLAVNAGGGNGRVGIVDTIILNNHTTYLDGGLYVHVGAGNLLELEYNVIAGNSADTDLGAGTVIGDGPVTIDQNTVLGNTTTSPGGTGGLAFGGLGGISIQNNIFRNNTLYGFYLATSRVGLLYNDYGTRGGMTPQNEVGTLNVNPQFVDAPGGNFHLAGNSPVLGASPIRINNYFDLDGNTSPQGGKVDLGAYEETIFVDRFDGN